MQKSPLAAVKEQFTDKAGLIKAVQALMTDDLWIDRVNADKGLDTVSNKKLLHLHGVLSAVKEQFGSRGKLVDAIVADAQRTKDADFRNSLVGKPTPDLYEIYRAGQKRAKKAS